ncbi:methylenetetrahydrofolate reductase [NAD(P)H] [Phragmitibacter flavus]|uniref:Methylenetetrahydrofolate reductase n=1 Tax=Phragmitibacter flavus TaxID=2576071 RepID=A0A5R8KA60_9BACT|nr:methylenetetrahydrofolate reductase [NAD(P)H] [Phragmitibacter flavus]TLD69191.1 methylenetetrahydrofolate reductase [NAD(P)H] [Phragmitibacter flavus]
MHIRDLLTPTRTTPTISFEFFPPNTTEASDRLTDTLQQLTPLAPDFVSVTYGAGGTTRHATQQLVTHLKTQTPLSPIPHLTCVNQQSHDIDAILENYATQGISNLLALRGDAPRHTTITCNDFPFGIDLVRHIQKFNQRQFHPDPRGFGIGVAGFPEGHPATPNRLLEMDHLKAKVDAGADYICTQLFFDNREYHDFRERCHLAGIHIPIIPGILPITSMANLRRMAELSGGTRIPARLLKALHRVQDDPAAVQQIGLHHATEQTFDLLHHNVPGIHFYTLNQSQPVLEILSRVGWKSTTHTNLNRSYPTNH